MADGLLNPADYVGSFLRRVAEHDDALHAWATIRTDDVLAEAAALQSGPRAGPLFGVPIGVKDVFETADLPTSYGSRAYAGRSAPADAACVAIARARGAIVMGKTATTEFASVAPCATRNPHALGHTPGGSSSGSAAAVASGMVPFAFGTQTAGSIIRPASYCGVVGFKPTFGAIPRAGLKSLSDSLDTVGVLGCDVRSVGWFGSIIADRPSWDAVPARALKIGLCRTPLWDRAQAGVRARIDHVVKLLRAAGIATIEVADPEGFFALLDAHLAIMAREVPQSLSDAYYRHPAALNPKTLAVAQPDAPADVRSYDRALALAERARHGSDALFQDCDVILSLSALDTAPAGLQSTGDPICNRVWTLLHLPCINVPAGVSDDGLPIGIQLIGPRARDETLLAAAAIIEDIITAEITKAPAGATETSVKERL